MVDGVAASDLPGVLLDSERTRARPPGRMEARREPSPVSWWPARWPSAR